ncbi:MAG: hypothetical protein ABW167_05230 [Baekduia sp.]
MLSERTSYIINKYMLKRPDAYGLVHFHGGLLAQARAVYWTLIRRWETEICQRCGRRVGPHTGSWWHAAEELWKKVMVEDHHVVCPPCFSTAAREHGILVCYLAIEGDPVPTTRRDQDGSEPQAPA